MTDLNKIREDAERGLESARAAEARFASILAELDAEPVDPPIDPPIEPPVEPPDPPPVIPTPGQGFTDLSKLERANVIFLDPDGDDANDGLSESRPVKTLRRGASLLRPGNPDWLMLKAGATWRGESLADVDLGGDNRERPMVLGVYGPREAPRPVIIPPHGVAGLSTKNQQIAGLLIQGLRFYAATRDTQNSLYQGRPGDVYGIHIRLSTKNGKFATGLKIEDCEVTHFDNNLILVDDWARNQGEGKAGRLQAVVRRNIVRYASTEDSHGVGIYLEGTTGTDVQDNLIDHNGWLPSDGYSFRNKRSHNIYAQKFNGPIAVLGNTIARAASDGLQLRAGGDILGNLFVRNALAFFARLNDSRAIGNVVLESDDMDPANPEQYRGFGIRGWELGRYEITDNIVARRLGQNQNAGISASADKIIVKRNIVHQWSDRDGNAIDVNSFDDVSDNITDGEFLDPTRGVTNEELDVLALRPRGVWGESYTTAKHNDYIREGFELQ